MCHPNQIKERGRSALMGFKQLESSFEYIVQMNFDPISNGSEAGISIFQKDDNYINFTLIKEDNQMLLQSYVLKNDKLIIDVRERLSQYNGSLKFKVVSDKHNYKLYYSLDEIIFNYFTTLNGNVIKSTGYTGAHLGLYATSNGKETSDLASFDFVNYLVKKK